MMTTQEIIKTVKSLPLDEQEKVFDALQGSLRRETKTTISEDEVERILFERGIIGNIPNRADYTDEDDDFEPIEVSGKPVSETIVEERR